MLALIRKVTVSPCTFDLLKYALRVEFGIGHTDIQALNGINTEFATILISQNLRKILVRVCAMYFYAASTSNLPIFRYECFFTTRWP